MVYFTTVFQFLKSFSVYQNIVESFPFASYMLPDYNLKINIDVNIKSVGDAYEHWEKAHKADC